ncbi:LPXTG cell wall anchor domain-containing protein [Staphylococcus aureus]|nr:LPXTG cell wall anchor domain-containing protein [Staphylococcus aureus]
MPTTEEGVTGAVTIPDYPSDKGTITKSPKNTNGNSVPTKKELPETGQQTDQGNATLFGSLFAALGGLFLVGKRRKNNNKEEK